MNLSGENKHKLASCLATELRSWFSKEDLDKIIKTFEAISSTNFKVLRTYSFALFLVNQYEAHFNTEPGLIDYVKFDLDDLLKTIKSNLAITNILLNDK